MLRSQNNTSDTGKKNRRITIETWGTSQDAGGGVTGSVISSYQMWANVENRDGRMIEAKDQRMWPYNYKVTVRYENSRPLNASQTILYDGNRLAINSIVIDREGMREENILRCSTISKC
jgi:SPP1 family predicted phage head-tail adaptor